MRKTGFRAGIVLVFGEFFACKFFRLVDHDGDAHEDFDVIRPAPGLHGSLTELRHLIARGRLALARQEHALRMLPGKGLPARGRARLKQHRRALRRQLAQVVALHVVIAAVMPDAVHLVGPCKHACSAIAQHRIVFPTAFPQLVEHIEKLVGAVVTLVVCNLLAQAHGARSASR